MGTSEGIYASSHIMKLQDDQAYDASLIDDIKERFCDYLKGGVQAPPAVIVPLRSALIPGQSRHQPASCCRERAAEGPDHQGGFA